MKIGLAKGNINIWNEKCVTQNHREFDSELEKELITKWASEHFLHSVNIPISLFICVIIIVNKLTAFYHNIYDLFTRILLLLIRYHKSVINISV